MTEVKTQLQENLEQFKKTFTNVQELRKTLKEFAETQDVLNVQMKEAKQAWTLRLADMDKDQLKEYGSNEAIREAKFKSENAELIKNIDDTSKMVQKIQDQISEGLSVLSMLKHEKDILICLAGLAAQVKE